MGKRVLVGVDGSAESRRAAELAAKLAKATGSSLQVAYVLPVIVDDGEQAARVVPWQAERTVHAHRMLNDMSEGLPRFTGEINTILLEGAPAPTLAHEAEHPDVWLVVVGHRGRGAIQRTLVGSVADRLTQISPKPVLVVR